MLGMTRKKVAVDPIFDADKTTGGIYIPDEAKHRCTQGIVRYIGESVRLVVPGDHILFPPYDGSVIILEEEGSLIILDESSIQAIIHDPIEFIPGLYIKDNKGEYFEAPLNAVTNMLKDTVASQDWFKRSQEKRMLRRRDEKYNASGLNNEL